MYKRKLVRPSFKTRQLVYTLDQVVEMGVACRSKLYAEHREGRLLLRKAGRRTVVLHSDFVRWLRSLPPKVTISRPHRMLVQRRQELQREAARGANGGT